MLHASSNHLQEKAESFKVSFDDVDGIQTRSTNWMCQKLQATLELREYLIWQLQQLQHHHHLLLLLQLLLPGARDSCGTHSNSTGPVVVGCERHLVADCCQRLQSGSMFSSTA